PPAPPAARRPRPAAVAALPRDGLRQTSMFGDDPPAPSSVEREVAATVEAAAPRRAARKANAGLRQAS
ncbi:MAG: hypothetical protein M3Z04_03730, partial [Chloroflexota bacterium]|nr:hypothetical protein [Chloroflexota bacterium]